MLTGKQLNRIHSYQLLCTLHWHGLVCRRCGDLVGKLSPPKGMQTNYMGSSTCNDPSKYLDQMQ